MIHYHLGSQDLSRVRFAFSPLQECVQSYHARSGGPVAEGLHGPWFARAERRLAGVDLEPMAVLMRPKHYIPDFLTPPPVASRMAFEDEIERMVQTPEDLVRQEVHDVFGDEMPPAAEPYLREPRAALHRLAEVMTTYWDLVLAPDWPRISALLEQDVLTHARTLALDGPERVFPGLHPRLSWHDGAVVLAKTCKDKDLYPGGEGLVLIPSVFTWPDVLTVIHPAPQTIWYPVRGIAQVWGAPQPAAEEALGRLLGAGRAKVLQRLRQLSTTGEIATALHLTPSAASQHLAVLHAAGLTDRHRSGRAVYYRLNEKGQTLLGLFTEEPRPEGEVIEFPLEVAPAG